MPFEENHVASKGLFGFYVVADSEFRSQVTNNPQKNPRDCCLLREAEDRQNVLALVRRGVAEGMDYDLQVIHGQQNTKLTKVQLTWNIMIAFRDILHCKIQIVRVLLLECKS